MTFLTTPPSEIQMESVCNIYFQNLSVSSNLYVYAGVTFMFLSKFTLKKYHDESIIFVWSFCQLNKNRRKLQQRIL